jgi:hypothetical protein
VETVENSHRFFLGGMRILPFSSKSPPSFPQLPQRDCGKLNFSKIHQFAQNFQEKPQSAPILFLKKDFFTVFSFRRLGNFYPFLQERYSSTQRTIRTKESLCRSHFLCNPPNIDSTIRGQTGFN